MNVSELQEENAVLRERAKLLESQVVDAIHQRNCYLFELTQLKSQIERCPLFRWELSQLKDYEEDDDEREPTFGQ